MKTIHQTVLASPAPKYQASSVPAERVRELKDMLQRARRMKLVDAVAEIQRLLKKAEAEAR